MSGSIRWPQSSNWHFVRFLGGLSHDRVGITTSAASDTTVVLPRRSENSCTSRPLSGSAAADDTNATAGGQQSAAASRVIVTTNTTRSLRGTRAAATTATGPIAAHPFSCNNCACSSKDHQPIIILQRNICAPAPAGLDRIYIISQRSSSSYLTVIMKKSFRTWPDHQHREKLQASS